MKIGLYFGSFNPIHNGHLIIAKHFVQFFDLNEVWFVVSPQNPFKINNHLLNEHHRINLIQSAIEGETKIKASNIEFYLPKPSFTINTLQYLKEKYPQKKFSIIMGSDGFENISKWKNFEQIIGSHEILIYERPGFEVNNNIGANIKIADAPLLSISSTYIRKLIKEDRSIRYLVPDVVMEEIMNNSYYRQKLKE